MKTLAEMAQDPKLVEMAQKVAERRRNLHELVVEQARLEAQLGGLRAQVSRAQMDLDFFQGELVHAILAVHAAATTPPPKGPGTATLG